MADQLFTDGDVYAINAQAFECVSVSYVEADGEKRGFVYGFRLKTDIDAERKEAEDKAEAERKAAEGNTNTEGEA